MKLNQLLLQGLIVFSSAATAEPDLTQSVLSPQSTQAGELATLAWILFISATVIFLIVMALLIVALMLSGKNGKYRLNRVTAKRFVFLAGVAIPLILLIALTYYSLSMTRSTLSEAPDDAINIEVTGYRWWWLVRYLDEQQQVIAETANEIHLPVGRAVRFILKSDDVIHSFWVPNLHGKTDMIPGMTNFSWVIPNELGTFRGQCAEYCGQQHANMAFMVIVEPEQDFNAWLDWQAEPAIEPVEQITRQGQRLFMRKDCQKCHQIRGTAANGDKGPDLTHLASRQTLAALTIPNTKGHLGGWILDPQGVKPGNLMPSQGMASEDFQALLKYLQSLH